VLLEAATGLTGPTWTVSSRTGPVGQTKKMHQVKSGERSAQRIRKNTFQKLTGTEPGLVAIWNFDNPSQPGRDESTNGHHAKLMERAKVVNSVGPMPERRPRMSSSSTIGILHPSIARANPMR
jgi:hypothetical protein